MKDKYIIFVILLFLNCSTEKTINLKKIYNLDITSKISTLKNQQKIKNTKNIKKQKKNKIKKKSKNISKKVLIHEININADKMVYSDNTKMTSFVGNVSITAQDIVIFADVLKTKDYKKEGELEGNVKTIYKRYNILIYSKKIKYFNNLKKIVADKKAKVIKTLENGNTLTLWADKIIFYTDKNLLEAVKEKKRIKIVYKDIIAFSDKLVYNGENNIVKLTGMPIVRKRGSIFLSKEVDININSEKMWLKDNIWTKIFYKDFEKVKKEVEGEIYKNRTSR